jgi:hypothetical protein
MHPSQLMKQTYLYSVSKPTFTNPPMRALSRAYTARSHMPAPLDPMKFGQALNDLGVTQAAIHAIRTSPPERARMLVDEIKAIAKTRFRQLAKLLHPDLTGGDAVKSARFSFLALVMKEIERMEPPASVAHRPPPITVPQGAVPRQAQQPWPPHPVRQQQRPQQRIHVVFRPTVVVQTQAPASSPPKATHGPNGVHVVNMKPG